MRDMLVSSAKLVVDVNLRVVPVTVLVFSNSIFGVP